MEDWTMPESRSRYAAGVEPALAFASGHALATSRILALPRWCPASSAAAWGICFAHVHYSPRECREIVGRVLAGGQLPAFEAMSTFWDSVDLGHQEDAGWTCHHHAQRLLQDLLEGSCGFVDAARRRRRLELCVLGLRGPWRAPLKEALAAVDAHAPHRPQRMKVSVSLSGPWWEVRRHLR